MAAKRLKARDIERLENTSLASAFLGLAATAGHGLAAAPCDVCTACCEDTHCGAGCTAITGCMNMSCAECSAATCGLCSMGDTLL